MRHLAPLLLVLAALPSLAHAQWSSDPAQNRLVVDRVNEQTQPKLAPTDDGGFYLSWFDNNPSGSPAFGYDVYLQRFDASGVEQWAHNGIRIADLGLSSTVDYDLATDTGGNALLTFQDDRPTGTQITAARVDATGSQTWGPSGVQLTSTTDFVANPKIVGTSDGDIVVAWIQASSVHVQRLDSSGTPQWSPELVLTPATGSYSTADLDATDSGECILSIVHGTGGFSAPRHLLAQKLDASGALLWGASHVAVFDGGSLQFGNFPQFVTDGNGGAVFGWYSASPTLQCFAQRLDAGGNELFPHNGSAVATGTSTLRVEPAVSYDPSSDSTYVFWVEKNSTQSQSGVGGQRFDASGARLWGTNGKTLVPLGTSAIASMKSLVLGGRAVASWTSSPSFGQDVARAALLDTAGNLVLPIFPLASTPSVKFRFEAETSALGFGIFVWRDERGADPDLYIQDLFPNGALGGLADVTLRNGLGANVVCFSSLTPPRLGTSWMTQVSHAHHPGATSTVVIARTTAYDGPLLGFGPARAGQLLIGGTLLYRDPVASSGSADPHALAIPLDLGLVGTGFSTQALILGGVLEYTNALDVTLGL